MLSSLLTHSLTYLLTHSLLTRYSYQLRTFWGIFWPGECTTLKTSKITAWPPSRWKNSLNRRMNTQSLKCSNISISQWILLGITHSLTRLLTHSLTHSLTLYSHILLQTAPDASKLIKRLNKLQSSLENLGPSIMTSSSTALNWNQDFTYDAPTTPIRYTNIAAITPHSQLGTRHSVSHSVTHSLTHSFFNSW